MNVTIVGAGYVGLVTSACLADAGNHVVCLDVDEKKVDALNAGQIPIYEPNLDTLIARCAKRGSLTFTTNLVTAVNHGDIQMIAVGTPPDEDGSADLSYVLKAAENIGSLMSKKTIIVTKSTVPVGTGDKVRAVINGALARRGMDLEFSIVSNPEFLREGDAIRDFKRPDRVVIGTDDDWAMPIVEKLYEPFVSVDRPIIKIDLRSAELAKYAANAMLATRISFMNELANLSESIGADIEAVRIAIGADPRIGPHFLQPGCGYGGSCFPKDVQALIRTAKNDAGRTLDIMEAVERVNLLQKNILFNKIFYYFDNNLQDKTIAVWGLAFKPDTDDMREAPSLVIVNNLLLHGARVNVFDPAAMVEAKRRFGWDRAKLNYYTNAIAAIESADALVLITEWSEFRSIDLKEISQLMRNKPVFDGRNIWNRKEMVDAGIEYFPIGRPHSPTSTTSLAAQRSRSTR